MKALIIDDSRTRRRVLASYLAEFTTDIYEAADAAQALAQLERHAPIDLAVVDWDMPRMNGKEFVEAVRANPASAETKLLMVASPDSLDAAGKTRDEGSNDFLLKPMTGKMVVDKIRLLGLAN